MSERFKDVVAKVIAGLLITLWLAIVFYVNMAEMAWYGAVYDAVTR